MRTDIWLASGLRTPFAKVDGALAGLDAIALSVATVKAMTAQLDGGDPDFLVWGCVAPNLTWSNIAREVLMDAGVAPTIPAFSTIMACSTSMIGALEAAGMLDGVSRNLALVGGVESMSRVQLGLGVKLLLQELEVDPEAGPDRERDVAFDEQAPDGDVPRPG